MSVQARWNNRPKRPPGRKRDFTQKLAFQELPVETQEEIVQHLNRKNLFLLLRVSKHFHSLASAEIYRTLNFELRKQDTPHGGDSSSRIGDALQTIVTSEHDYAQYIRSFRITVTGMHPPNLSGRLRWGMVADSSKLLNTALLLMLRKAKILENFQCDAPLELSSAVYQALHKIQSLRSFLIRLDIPKLIKPPISTSSTVTPAVHTTGFHPPPPPPHSSTSLSSGTTKPHLRDIKKQKTGRYDYWANGRAFSGFNNLSNLSVLGINNLDCLTEVAECLKASSASLKLLALSLSPDLSRKAHKPSIIIPTVNDPSDTEADEDEDTWDAPPNPTTATGTFSPPQANEADVRKEKLAQEAVLARIFDLQMVSEKGKKVDKYLAMSAPGPDILNSTFTRDIDIILKKLVDYTDPSPGKDRIKENKLALEEMQRAAVDYLRIRSIMFQKKEPSAVHKAYKEHIESKAKGPEDYSSSTSLSNQTYNKLFGDKYEHLVTAAALGLEANTSLPSDAYMSPYVLSPNQTSKPPMNFPPHAHKSHSSIGFVSTKDMNDVYTKMTGNNLDDPLFLSIQEPIGTPPSKSSTKKSMTPKIVDPVKEMDLVDSEDNVEQRPLFHKIEASREDEVAPMDVDMEHPDEDVTEANEDQEIMPEVFMPEIVMPEVVRPEVIGPEVDETESSTRISKRARREVSGYASPSNSEILQRIHRIGKGRERQDQAMHQYILATHGLHIEELSLHLIPLKASILARALDLSVLRRITLLSVGSQDGFWCMLTKWQQSCSAPIRFESIHTDNVSPALLGFLETFEGLEELFLFERARKSEAEALSPKTCVIGASIRKQALRKHLKTLKRLSIINEEDDTWDADARMVRLLAGRGGGLLELKINISVKDYHILLQTLPGLSSLIALDIPVLRSEDTCPSVIRECRKFTIDNIAHCRELKIEYLAMSNVLVRIARKPKSLQRLTSTKGKGKGKAAAIDVGTPEDLSVDSDEEVSDGEVRWLEMAMVEVLEFEEVEGVRIFEKTVIYGIL